MAGPHLDAEAAQEQRRLGDEQLVSVLDLTAEVVRQTAVGERDIRVALEDDDPSVLVHAPRTRGGRGTAGDTADDEDGAVPRLAGGQGSGLEQSRFDPPID